VSVPPPDQDRLSIDACFLLWALRERRAAGRVAPDLARGFCSAFGLASVEAALAAFNALYEAIRLGLRRNIVLGCRCRPWPTDDERLLLDLVRGCREGALHEAHRAARGLVEDSYVAATVVQADRFARILDDARFVAGARHGERAAPTVPPGSLTIH
jgi:hypothetical protein